MVCVMNESQGAPKIKNLNGIWKGKTQLKDKSSPADRQRWKQAFQADGASRARAQETGNGKGIPSKSPVFGDRPSIAYKAEGAEGFTLLVMGT